MTLTGVLRHYNHQYIIYGGIRHNRSPKFTCAVCCAITRPHCGLLCVTEERYTKKVQICSLEGKPNTSEARWIIIFPLCLILFSSGGFVVSVCANRLWPIAL